MAKNSPWLDGFLLLPIRDLWHGLDRSLDNGYRSLAAIFIGLLVGWWIYVPSHELLHAYACMLGGGEVSQLQIAPLYGGHILASWLPFVEAGGDYAGRLAGFDTSGNDWIYLLTDLGPFVLTLVPGVWALRSAVKRASAFGFGFWLPFALAPFLSWSGDGFEIGGLMTTQFGPWASEPVRGQLISDDLFLWLKQAQELPSAPWGGAVSALLMGTLWTFTTYWLGDRVSTFFGRPAIPARELPTDE